MPYEEKTLEGGHAASHSEANPFPIYASPATGAEKNVIREDLITVACWKVNDLRFDFGSSFVMPETKPEFTELKELVAKNPKAPLSVFGHADPTGDDESNKSLSGRRAEAIYAVLIRDAARWEKIYKADGWSLKHVQIMLKALGRDPGNTSGSATAQSTQTIKDFQSANGLTPDGAAGPDTRAKLMEQYMQFLWPDKLDKSAFLGGGADSGGKGDYQGCSEFNPVMVFSKAENTELNKPANKSKRDEENSVNRRVMILLFRPGTKAPAAKWPCPRAAEGAAGCRKRFWSDGDARRSNQDARRTFVDDEDTFACRFYHRLAVNSPCEKPGPPTPEIKPKVKGKLFWNRTWDYNDETKAFGPVKEYLPGAKIELHVKPLGGALQKHGEAFLTDDGEFAFTDVPKSDGAEIKIFLEHKDGKKVVMKGKSSAVAEAKFEIKKDQVIWHQMVIDATPLTAPTQADIDLGDLEIKKALFVDLCDAYKSVWFGHKRILDMASVDLPLCPVFYPETGISHVSGLTMHLLKDDLKDRDVIEHEYGHFITHATIGDTNHPGYGYNDDATGGHTPTSKEHYEAAWLEGHATFLSCAIMDDPHYHDGYDTNLNMHLDTDNTLVGPHCEGSIQCALWRIHKVHNIDFKSGFWKALTDTSKRKVNTVYDFFDNWKDLGCPDIDNVIESFKKFNIEFGYKYRDGAGRFTNVGSPKVFDAAKQEFQTIVELHTNLGTTGGGTQTDYNEEFYNRNKQFNSGSLAAGSTIASPKVTGGKKYIVPERFQIKK
jgi:hypothetical protein